MHRRLVSVIITTYKRKVDQVKNAIDSVLNQTYNSLELIIVDDSPQTYEYRTDLKLFCEQIDDNRVKYIQHEKNSGACVARNTGIANSRGDYICFLDDDDEYLPDRIEKMMNYFNDSEVVMVYADAAMYSNGVFRRKYSDIMKPREGNVYDEIMKEDFIGSTSMTLVRANIIKEVGGFNPEMEASQDWETWIRICALGKISYCPEVLMNYYAYGGEGNDTRISNDTNRRIRALHHLNEINKGYLDNHPEALAVRKSYELRLHIINKDIKKALCCYITVWLKHPTAVVRNIVLLKAFGRLIIKPY